MDFATIKGQGCAVCVSVCPFSQAGYDKIQGGFLLYVFTNCGLPATIRCESPMRCDQPVR